MSKLTFSAWLLVISAAAMLSGCKTDCEKLVAMLEECGDEKPTDSEKAELIEKCEKNKDKDQFKELIPCGAKSDCSEFEACQEEYAKKREEAFKKKMLDEDLAEIQKAIDAKKFEETPIPCYGLDRDDVAEELKTKCGEFATQAVTAMTTEITAIRDERKGDDKLFTKCMQFEDNAKKISEDEGKKAKQLCDEANAAGDLKKTLEAVQKNIDNKIADLPWECSSTIDSLEKMVTDWSKGVIPEVAKKCYLELGVIVLQAKVPTMQYVCDYNVQQIIEGAKKHNLSSPEFDAERAKAKPLCEK